MGVSHGRNRILSLSHDNRTVGHALLGDGCILFGSGDSICVLFRVVSMEMGISSNRFDRKNIDKPTDGKGKATGESTFYRSAGDAVGALCKGCYVGTGERRTA